MRRHGQLGAYQLAVEGGAFAEHGERVGRGGAVAARHGHAAKSTTLQLQPPLDTDDEPDWARDLVGRSPRAWPARSSPPRRRSQCGTCQVKDSCPAYRRGGGCDGRRHGIRAGAPGRPTARSAGERSTSPGRSASRTSPRPSRWPSSRRPCGPCSSWPGPGRARPRRWRPGSSGSSPTTSCAPTRCSASPSPARPRASCPSGWPPGWPRCARRGCGPRRQRRRRCCARRRAHGVDLPRVRRSDRARARRCGSGSRPRAGCSARRRPGSSRTRRSASWDGPMDGVDKAESTVTTAVVDLAGEMAEHLVGAGDVARAPRRGRRRPSSSLPKRRSRKRRTFPAEVRDAHQPCCASGARSCPWSSATTSSSAAATPWTSPTRWRSPPASRPPCRRSARAERARFRAVLLDEFQDTSEAQLQLLRRCSSRRAQPVPVTAVGDPHQSIYGWRGASSTTLHRFRDRLRRPRAAARAAAVDELAQRHGDPRRRQPPGRPAGAPPPGCRSRRWPRAPRPAAATSPPRGSTRSRTRRAYVADVGRAPPAPRPGRRTAAVLCRKRSQFDPVVEALEARGHPATRSSASAVCCTRPRWPTSSRCLQWCRTPPAATG